MAVAVALTKWCPMVRYGECSENKPATIGVGVSPPTVSMCIADRCMMWRWSTFELFGYCGLAGEDPDPA
jgi:hypothetical protein